MFSCSALCGNVSVDVRGRGGVRLGGGLWVIPPAEDQTKLCNMALYSLPFFLSLTGQQPQRQTLPSQI